MNSEEMQAAWAADETELNGREPGRWKVSKVSMWPGPHQVPDDQQCCVEAYVTHGTEHAYDCDGGMDSQADEAGVIDWEAAESDLPEVPDLINHPPHYTAHPSGVECITITEHMGFNLGNALKYIWRADLKGDAIADIKKAAWYCEREIARRSRG